MFCRNCGTEIPEGQISCPACGTQVSAASLQMYNQTHNTQQVKRNSNFGYLAIICVLLGVIAYLGMEAINSRKLDYGKDIYPEIEVETTSTNRKVITTEPTYIASTDQEYKSNGYVFSAPSDYTLLETNGETIAQNNSDSRRFSMRVYEGTYTSLEASIEYIKNRFVEYGYENISAEPGDISGVKYYVIYFTREGYDYARIISVVNDSLLFQSDCILNISETATSNYYINTIVNIVLNAHLETSNLVSTSIQDIKGLAAEIPSLKQGDK